MKKIISFSLWGNNRKYLIGALENMKCQSELFPDWICRFYCHTDVDKSWLLDLSERGAEVIIKYENPVVRHMHAPGMFWRFEVLKDKEIERCLVRDTDGRLTQREKNCVIDWEKSGREFHIIRDHVMHSTRIMGGVWGATNALISRINYDELLDSFSRMTYVNMYATDQEFLARVIYPLIKDNVCIHDDWYRFPDEKPCKIPHVRVGNEYIGMPYEVD